MLECIKEFAWQIVYYDLSTPFSSLLVNESHTIQRPSRQTLLLACHDGDEAGVYGHRSSLQEHDFSYSAHET